MTPPSALLSLLNCLWYIALTPLLSLLKVRSAGPPPPEALLLNGPGTCFVLCIAVYFNKVCMLMCSVITFLCHSVSIYQVLWPSGAAHCVCRNVRACARPLVIRQTATPYRRQVRHCGRWISPKSLTSGFRFVVQWPDNLSPGRRGEFRGWMV
jgi:hypothetical protein